MKNLLLGFGLLGGLAFSGQTIAQTPPSGGVPTQVFSCFYECKAGRVARGIPTWQEVTTLMLTNQDTAETRQANVMFLDGNENILGRVTALNLSPEDLKELHVCRTLLLNGLSVPSAGLVEISLAPVLGGGVPPGGVYGWVKNLLGKFLVTENEPFAGRVTGIAKTECQLVPEEVATPQEIEAKFLASEAPGDLVPILIEGTVIPECLIIGPISGSVLRPLTNGQDVRVIINNRANDPIFPSSKQIATAVVEFEVEGLGNVPVNVHFRTIDPDDESPYEAGTAGGDNLDPQRPLGNLAAAPGFTEVRNVQDANGNKVEIIVTSKFVSGKNIAKVRLTTTTTHAGDNYIIEARSDPSARGPCATSGIFVAWRRVYYEDDRAFVNGSPINDVARGGRQITLAYSQTIAFSHARGGAMGGALAAGNRIRVFDNADGENATVDAVNLTNNSITLSAPLITAYKLARGAGYVKLGTGDSLPGTIAPEITKLTDAFGRDTPGTDGGAFTEWKRDPILAVHSNIPHINGGGLNAPNRRVFAAAWASWRNNPAPVNHSQFISQRRVFFAAGDATGATAQRADGAYQFVNVGLLRDNRLNTQAAEVTVHESGHHWFPDARDLRLGRTDLPRKIGHHAQEKNWDNSDACIMDVTERFFNNGITEFARIDLFFIRENDQQ